MEYTNKTKLHVTLGKEIKAMDWNTLEEELDCH